jgi:hypothetical protein
VATLFRNRCNTPYANLSKKNITKSNKTDVKEFCCLDGYFVKNYIVSILIKRGITLSSTSANPSSNPSNSDSNLSKVIIELGAAGTLTTLATQASVMGIGQVAIMTVGASAVTVSLPAVVALGAASYLGLSLGKKMVDAINRA